ncbi:AAA family ATPase [Rickettsia sp. MEAM1 (Bemisia tabaci)]|uniref:ATP-binding protein n=1 Tax=unclassified Rickettsia TaxID=114295 RepID=UPI00031321A7|nr:MULTISPECIES: ATP-binding protein [unclassified Rickettsia]ASX28015.1 AAA family ATPase [Rickettsia sp. MEAM1 (Bemisia tabaci)]MCC8377097.1 ATP-binding protein [Rickettsia endosymbiont of Graphium doson]ODA37484.1 AAA family ATPase [Rickettsia sp. wb]ODA38243.1 AAA family ATPase [Rickettsia sp. wq]
MYQRFIQGVLEKFSKFYPVLGITGPRQSGKTTLAKILFPHLPYVSLENLDTRIQAQQDLRSFLANYQNGAIFDEVQHVPELLSYLQGVVDESSQKGRYVITGSQNFSLSHHISQSLSGRIGMVTLLPLSLSELKEAENPLASIFKGGYPLLHNLNMHPLDFYPSYIQTYIERDVRQLKNIENFNRFQTFLKLCAGRIGQIVNFSSLALDCGISHTTARQWLGILEASYIIFFLQPFYKNFNKRLIKMPKLYFYDTGIACTLLGLEKEQQLETHYLKGALYENLVILELLKGRLNLGLPANFYFWKDKSGHEIDFVAEWGGTIKAVEIKFNSTFQPDYIKNLNYFYKLDPNIESYLVYNGIQESKFLNTSLIPLKQIDKILK